MTLSIDDGFTMKEYSEWVTGTMEVIICCPYIFLTLYESVQNRLPRLAVLAPLKSLIACRREVRIFRNTTILVVISYLILLDINLSFVWLAIFPLMAIVFIRALYLNFGRRTERSGRKGTPGSSKAVEKKTRKTRELMIIVMMTLGALFVMDQLTDHAAQGFPISQFLLFLSSTVAALTRMMTKLPTSASLPGVAPASEMLHKSLLLLLLVTVHTLSAEWLGEDVVLLCLPEVIPVLLWFSLHLDRKPGSGSIISVDKMKSHGKSLVFLGAVVVLVAALFAYPAFSVDEFALSGWCTTFLVSCGVSGILTYYLAFMLSHWPKQQVTSAGMDEASGTLKLWAYALMVAAAASLLFRCLQVSARLGLPSPLHAGWLC